MRASFFKSTVRYAMATGTEPSADRTWQTAAGFVRARLMNSAALIRNGVPSRGMPAFDLPPAELDSITLLVRSWNAPASESNPPGNRSAGESYFFGAGGCSRCHMVMGRGTAIRARSLLAWSRTDAARKLKSPSVSRPRVSKPATNSRQSSEKREKLCEDSRGTAAATTYNSRISTENSICSMPRRSQDHHGIRLHDAGGPMLCRTVQRLACIPQLVDRTCRGPLGRHSKTKVARHSSRSPIRSPATGPPITETSAAIATAR